MTGNTADRLAAAALTIVTNEGAQAVTMRRVAADAGVTTMATYRHYPNRATLLHTVADNALAMLSRNWGHRTTTTDFQSRFNGLMHDFFDFALGKPKLYMFVMTDRREGARQFPQDFGDGAVTAFSLVVEVIAQGMRERVLREDNPLEVTFAVTSMAEGMVHQYIGNRVGMPEPEFRALAARSITRMLNGLKT